MKLASTAASLLVGAAMLLPAPPAQAATGMYATFLFSRTEVNAADACRPDGRNIVRLTEVADYLASKGMKATGTLVTGHTTSTPTCTHHDSSLTAAWWQATALAKTYGWSFVSHTATYPDRMDQLTPKQQWAETCGSARTLEAHGLPGAHGMIAYPGAQPAPVAMQTNYGSRCFAWGRQYHWTGTTTEATAPYWQVTKGLNGGPCNQPGLPCYSIVSTGSGTTHYNMPDRIISRVTALTAGQWFTVQNYLLVRGRSPAYTANPTRWDCTSADPKLHWSNDVERYCFDDWKKIVDAVAARPITVTDPLTVGVAFGRPATYP